MVWSLLQPQPEFHWRTHKVLGNRKGCKHWPDEEDLQDTQTLYPHCIFLISRLSKISPQAILKEG